MPVHHGPVHALDRVPLELQPQAILRGRIPGEDDQAGRIAVDAVDHQRPALSVRPQMLRHLIENRRRAAPPLEGDREQARGLVEHDQRVIFEDDAEVAGSSGYPAARAAGAVDPHAYEVADGKPPGRRVSRSLGGIDEDLTAIEGYRRAASRPKTSGLGEKLVEPQTLLIGTNDPFHLLEFARVLILKRVAAIVFLAVAIPYALAPVYRFPPPRTFSGPALWNPYAHLTGSWQRANLHAHGHAWNGLTNGTHTDDEVVQAYRQRGYSVAGVSDYQWIAAQHGVPTMPLYEHGYNISKEHQLAIGAQRVEWLDFLLWTWINQKQFVLNQVASTSALVAINHPGTAYSEGDLRKLTGYHLMEVINGPFGFEDLWDAALSSGHPVWALANDDIHDLTNVRRLAIAWNMIDAPSAEVPDIIAALRAGRAYAVSLVGEKADAALASVHVKESSLTVSSTGVPATYVFIGQNGAVRQTFDQVMQATYAIGPTDTYIRTVIRTPNMVMYLNPVLRYDGANLPAPAAIVNEPLTWLSHGFVVVLGIAVPLSLWRRRSAPSGSEPQ